VLLFAILRQALRIEDDQTMDTRWEYSLAYSETGHQACVNDFSDAGVATCRFGTVMSERRNHLHTVDRRRCSVLEGRHRDQRKAEYRSSAYRQYFHQRILAELFVAIDLYDALFGARAAHLSSCFPSGWFPGSARTEPETVRHPTVDFGNQR
jgi:hypothetical protein